MPIQARGSRCPRKIMQPIDEGHQTRRMAIAGQFQSLMKTSLYPLSRNSRLETIRPFANTLLPRTDLGPYYLWRWILMQTIRRVVLPRVLSGCLSIVLLKRQRIASRRTGISLRRQSVRSLSEPAKWEQGKQSPICRRFTMLRRRAIPFSKRTDKARCVSYSLPQGTRYEKLPQFS
jgi:hypothetical protein